MAFPITKEAKLWADSGALSPNLVMKFSKVDKFFATQIIKKEAAFGDAGLVYGMPGLNYGSKVALGNQDDLISVSGTSNTVSQQLEIDKPEATSTSSLTVRLVDIDETITRLISTDVNGGIELLADDVTLYLGGAETTFPDDYIEIFNGQVQSIIPGAGYVDFTIVHPEEIKRSEIFPRKDAVLTQDVLFNSGTIQGIQFQAQPDVIGTVSIQFTSGASGDVAIVSVTGNIITVQIDTVATRIKTVKKKIDANEDAAQLVITKLVGDGNAFAALQSLTNLTTSTEIFLDDVTGFYLPTATPLFKTYVRIGQEIIEYTAIDTVAKKLTGITRGALNSFSFNHEIGDEATSFYKLGDGTGNYGNGIDLVLMTLLSAGPQYYAQELRPFNIGEGENFTVIRNAIYFKNKDVVREYGLILGDYVTCEDAINGANNFTDRRIDSFGSDDLGYWFTVDGLDLTQEPSTTAKIKIRSQYNVLPDGCGLLPKQVDIERFLYVRRVYSSLILAYELYLKDTISSKDFINKDLLLPSGLRSIPRRGRISCGVSANPLFDKDTRFLSTKTVLNPSQLKIGRTLSKNFYNAVVWKYNEDSVEDSLLSGLVTLSARSTQRINSQTKPLKIEARGIRYSLANQTRLQNNTDRILKQFEFAAESITGVKVPFSIGWTIDVGDPIIIEDASLKLSDITKGSREFEPRLFEVSNKSLNWRTGEIVIDIVGSGFAQDLRFGVFSPSSYTGSGSTQDRIKIVRSFETTPQDSEQDKWSQYVGKQIKIYAQDHSVSYNTTLIGFDPSSVDTMIVSPALPVSVPSGYLVGIVNYNDISLSDSFLKSVNVFWNPRVSVASGTSQTVFNVSGADISKFFVGSLIRIHDANYTRDSGLEPIQIVNISGNTITLQSAAGFIPQAGDIIDFIGFAIDDGKAYAFV